MRVRTLSVALTVCLTALLLPSTGSLYAIDAVDPSAYPKRIMSLTVSPKEAELLIGEVLQLTLIAEFDDGSTEDLTADEEVTYDHIEDDDVVRIEPGGRIRALSGGTIVVGMQYSAGLNIGLDWIFVTVIDPDDTDNDGLPNDVELRHGLDPNFATDADLDFDDDDLINRDEIAAGTDLRRGDTDGDGKLDGIEIFVGTDPLVPDQGIASRSSLLDENCVVSVLNRTAPVDSDGVWVLSDVPASFGQVRVRATCDEEGVTRSGQSDFFTVPVDDVVEVPEIRFDAPAPIPQHLEMTAATGGGCAESRNAVHHRVAADRGQCQRHRAAR